MAIDDDGGLLVEMEQYMERTETTHDSSGYVGYLLRGRAEALALKEEPVATTDGSIARNVQLAPLWLALPWLLAAGCHDWKDVTYDPAYNRGFPPGQTYTLRQPAFLMSDYVLEAPGGRGGTGASVERYLRNPREFPDIRGVVAAGTRLRAERLRLRLTGFKYVNPEARVLDGVFEGRLVSLAVLGHARPKDFADVLAPGPPCLDPEFFVADPAPATSASGPGGE